MRILWAFDPFEETQGLQKTTLSLLSRVADAGAKITAVYTNAEPKNELAAALDPRAARRSGVAFEALLKDRVRKLGGKTLAVAALQPKTLSLTDAARTFAGYAEDKNADLIVLPTHARRGFKRMLLGSFAETLVHESRTDLLLFNPGAKLPSGRLQSILYCHDFSNRGETGLRKAIEYTKLWGAVLHVVHIPKPVYSVHFEGQDESAEKYRHQIRTRLKKLEEFLIRQGLSYSLSLETGWSPLGEMLLKAAKRKKADVVIVTAKSGRLAALIGGSTTRYLLRHSPLPTLVLKVR